MNRAIRAAVLVLAAGMVMGGCAHDNGKHNGDERSAFDRANESTTSAAENAGRGAREAFDEANEAVTDFFKGLREGER